MGGRLDNVRFLIRDRDAKFSGPFDEVLGTEGVRVIRTPVRAPKANAVAERWVRTVRQECLDCTLELFRSHLDRVVSTYVTHYNEQRPHRGLGLATPEGGSSREEPARTPGVKRRDVLGGLIHEYYADAA